MTSKQVRKAHKAATKLPTMTRAERYKWEREEQERIRKDHEKEKAAAKAKAARDKKKEKDVAAREEKRRNGLPLVNVRPSQDTIARFVRGNGSGMKRDAQGKAVTVGEQEEEAQEEEDEQDEQNEQEAQELQELQEKEREMKNTALDSILEMEEESDDALEAVVQQGITGIDVGLPIINNHDSSRQNVTAADSEATIHNDTVEEPSQGISPENKGPNHNMNETSNVTFSQDLDADLGLEDAIDEAEIAAALDRAQANVPAVPTETPPNANIANQNKDDEPIQKGPTVFMSSQDLLLDDEDLNLEMLEELDQLMTGPTNHPLPRPMQASPKETTKNVQLKSPEPKNAHGNTNKSASSIHSTPRRTKKSPQRRVQMQSSSPHPPRQPPPMSTQAILVNFDDFFPTSSQQLRELEEGDETIQEMAQSTSHGEEHQKTAALAQPVLHANTIIQQETASKATPLETEVVKAGMEIDDFESDFGSFPSTAHFSFAELSMAQQPQEAAPIQTPHIQHTSPHKEHTSPIQAQATASAEKSMAKPLSVAQHAAPIHHTPKDQAPPASTAEQQPVSEALSMSPPARPKTPQPSQPQPQPPNNNSQPRFFTSSGSRERLSIALQRSRRSAALEEIRQRDRQRQEAGYWLLQKKQQDEAAAAAAAARQREMSVAEASTPKMNGKDATDYNNMPSQKLAKGHQDKENVQPPARVELVGGSQESEYGGDWVDDAAWDLNLC